jgi:hypothetical protein
MTDVMTSAARKALETLRNNGPQSMAINLPQLRWPLRQRWIVLRSARRIKGAFATYYPTHGVFEITDVGTAALDRKESGQ